tara:strand:+ start:196 stop:429 length:234 start_codon:yes stop_codon:yes gene_type:complete
MTTEIIDAAAKELKLALEAFDQTDTEKKRADREHTVSVNRLNKAQAAFDAAVVEIRKTAPWATDWYSRQGREKEKAG